MSRLAGRPRSRGTRLDLEARIGSGRGPGERIVVVGKQAEFAVNGGLNEDLVRLIIGRIAAYAEVPRKHDYGIDAFCQVRVTAGDRAFSVKESFSIQIKGEADLVYGGIKRGKWQQHEIEWLRTLAVPFYLVRVDPSLTAVEMFSLAPLWHVLWGDGRPFQITCTTRPASDEPVNAPALVSEAVPERSETEGGEHSGKHWKLDLGPPFLRLTNERLNESAFLANAVDCLRRWIHYDRRTILRFQLRLAIVDSLGKWSTNDFSAPHVYSRAMYWNATPGMNLPDLLPLAAEVLMNLGVNLQWQNDRSAYRLIEALDYLDEVKALDSMGQGLVAGLKKTRVAGRDPYPDGHDLKQ